MIWGMWDGIVGRVRTQLAEWDIARTRAQREQFELKNARELDAAEVGRRADLRRAAHEAQTKSDSSIDH